VPPGARKWEAAHGLIIGLTACSALQSNNYAFKPIRYVVEDVRLEAVGE